jgi:ribosome-associated toxin RatA of RatAB toxin-antitoxin module
MPRVQRSALVSYSSSQMYQLVNDVERYPEFIKQCVATQVHEQSDQEMSASIFFNLGPSGIKKSFKTRNTLISNESIQMTLDSGPFKALKGAWNFTRLADDACKIELDLHFEFSNKLMEIGLNHVFSQLCSSMMDAFIARAQEVYHG